VKFDDGAVDTRGQAEVVGIHNQSAHGVSLSTSPSRPALLAT
jgi:hypothetical protein